MALAHDGLPVPTTPYLPRRLLDGSFDHITGRLGVSFILKAMNASGGRLNFLIKSETDFQQKLRDPAHAQVAFLAQQFTPNNGTFRAYASYLQGRPSSAALPSLRSVPRAVARQRFSRRPWAPGSGGA
jgi:glutathione synthase/RimK-type ligase-like ATP-grasp enzyme